jgi:hypothetical protein
MDDCEQHIRQLLRKQIVQWIGLSPNCPKSEVIASFSFNEGEGISRYGTKYIEYQFRVLPFEGFPEGVFFYFLREQLSHISAAFWSFDRQECANILQQLGEPAQRLNFSWGQQTIPDSELIYPANGIAIGLIPASGLIALVKVFAPCTTTIYKERYWNTKHAREF